ncbi:hypothetical protein B296_00031280 [Ensete ventricosum]|uniref:Uncharacterized protein n=1 Tax=Ensete ventricosum TaxID=4639 RepID=A0A426XHP2_ENSVE|nr:hypothetical protein B296_00031280 [Ensete ventricosum]
MAIGKRHPPLSITAQPSPCYCCCPRFLFLSRDQRRHQSQRHCLSPITRCYPLPQSLPAAPSVAAAPSSPAAALVVPHLQSIHHRFLLLFYIIVPSQELDLT